MAPDWLKSSQLAARLVEHKVAVGGEEAKGEFQTSSLQRGHSRLAAGRFNKQGNLLMRLVLDGHKMSRSPHSPARILNVYLEAWMGFSYIYCPDGPNNTLPSQGHVIGQLLVQNSRQRVHSKDGGGDEEYLIAQVQLMGQPEVMSSQWPPPTRLFIAHLPEIGTPSLQGD